MPDDEGTAFVKAMSPAEQMSVLDIAQEGDPVLAEVARPFDLPAEAEDARRVVVQLVSTLERVGQVHNFSKGMGLAAPQIHIGRAAAVVRTPAGETVTLLNPRICDESAGTDEQYEGCLSFFDVRGKVRPGRWPSRWSTRTSMGRSLLLLLNKGWPVWSATRSTICVGSSTRRR